MAPKSGRKTGFKIDPSLLNCHQDKVFFFAVGLQHLLGKGKIQEVLEAAGYSVQRVSPEEKERDSLRESGEL